MKKLLWIFPLIGAAFLIPNARPGTAIISHRFVTGSIASSFSPTNLSGCQMYVEADTLSLSDGASVNDWPDLTVHGKDAVQYKFSGTLQPSPVYKINIQNGQPAVYFNGACLLSNSYPIISGPSTIVVVAMKTTAGFTFQQVIDAELPGNPLLNTVTASRATDHWGTYLNSIKESGYDCNSWTVMTSCSDGLTSNPTTNICYTMLNAGETMTDSARFGGDSFTRMAIGADEGGPFISGYFTGYIYAIGIWNRQLSPSEVATVVGYFKTKLGI